MDLSFFNVWVNALIHPKETFQKEKGNASLIGAIKNIAIAGLIAGVIVGIFTIISVYLFPLSESDIYSTLVSPDTVKFMMIAFAVVMMIVYPIFNIIGLFIFSAILFILAKILGGKGDFTTQTYLISLFFAPIQLIALLISLIGSILSTLFSLYYIYPLTLSLKETHDFSTKKAVLVWLIPIGVVFLLGVILWQMGVFAR